MGVSTNTSERQSPVHKCVEFFRVPPEALELPQEERKDIFNKMMKTSDPGGFAKNAFAETAKMNLLEEIGMMIMMGTLIGGPLMTFYFGVYFILFGTWTQMFIFFAVLAVLVLHPLKRVDGSVYASEKWTISLYKYFSYRLMWVGDDVEKARENEPWIGAASPHGVLPIANVLSMPAINAIMGTKFIGAAATAIFNAPVIRYLTLLGCTEVSGKAMAKAIEDGYCVGMNPDGIAGIFKCSHEEEVVFLKERKGLAKFCLTNGVCLVPAYSVGNSEAFHLWFDPLGIMEGASRRLQTSLFIYWGRLGLPIPRRVNVTLLIGQPIPVEKVEKPSQEQIDALHSQLLRAMKEMFDAHKDALGVGHKQMTFV